MSVYLRASADEHVTGDVLHLSVTDRRDDTSTALCGSKITGRWLPTGPDFDGWQRHSHWPICTLCRRTVTRLDVAMREQTERVVRHADTPMTTARHEPVPYRGPTGQPIVGRPTLEDARAAGAALGERVRAIFGSATSEPARVDFTLAADPEP